jgi:hypothetical protein
MEGTVTAMDKDGNVLLIGRFFDLNGRKALEISIRTLYGIQVYATAITPADEQEDNLVEPMGQSENDYWLPPVSGSDNDDTAILRKVI